MAVKKHFSLTGSNSTVISWIFYEKAEQKSLLKTNKQTQQKTKQTTTCCCQVPVTHKPRDYRAWPRCTWEDLSWHLPCTIREFHCLAIITLVGEWEREKGIQLPATLLKMYNWEEEMCQIRKWEQEETWFWSSVMGHWPGWRKTGCNLCLKAYKHIFFHGCFIQWLVKELEIWSSLLFNEQIKEPFPLVFIFWSYKF